MTQSQLNRAVARATGEDVRTIAGRGFTTLLPGPRVDGEEGPQILDWDAVEDLRGVGLSPRRRRPPVLA